MDNQNNQNPSNPFNPTTLSATGPTPPPPMDLPASQPSWAPPAATDLNNPFPAPTPTPLEPASVTPLPANPAWPPLPSMPSEPAVVPSTFTPPTADLASPSSLDNPWGSPVQTPAAPANPPPPMDLPASQPSWAPPAATTPPANPAWPPLPSMPSEPAVVPSTFTPPTADLASPSSLDNPWGSPVQTPAIDAAPSQPEPIANTDSTPTDLSHLISNNTENNGQSASTAPETLVVPSSGPGTIPEATIPSQEHKGVPKWLIGVGVALLIIVAGTSAYFILGIGQPPKTTTSVPAEVSNPTINTAPPIANPVTQPSPATESANFGQLQGSQQATQATSAAELLRQRQQGQ